MIRAKDVEIDGVEDVEGDWGKGCGARWGQSVWRGGGWGRKTCPSAMLLEKVHANT